MKQREERALSGRDMSDREATELEEVLFRDPNNLDALTPPARVGEHLRWVARKDEGKFRSRVAQGYRAARYSDYPDFPPFKNLIVSATVAPEDVITHRDDLILMTCSDRYAATRSAHYGRLAHEQNVGAHRTANEKAQMPGNMQGLRYIDQSHDSAQLQRGRPSKLVSFGE